MFIQTKFPYSLKIDKYIPMNFITWTIFATLRLSFAILSLHSLQEDRFDFAYSVLNGRSSAILTKNGMEETGLTADWLELRANS